MPDVTPDPDHVPDPDPVPEPRADPAAGGTVDDSAAVLGCEVTSDAAGWWVELVVGFADDVVRRRIGPYLTEPRARVAAHHIARAAGRETPPPTGL